jgi:Tfp pilus assembly protein PilO
VKDRGPIAAAVIGGIVVLLMILVIIVPELSRIHSVKDQLTVAQQQTGTLQNALAELKATEQRAKAIRVELDLLEAAVPPDAALPDLIRMLNDTSDQSGVDFMSVAPGQPVTVTGAVGPTAPAPAESGASPTPTVSILPPPVVGASLPEGISVVPMAITINGSYFAIDEYLFRLESSPRISKVTQISLTIGQGGYPELSLSLTVDFYTTDLSSGPGSQPQQTATPSSSPSPSATPTGSSG